MIGNRITGHNYKGELVPDSLTNKIVKDRLAKEDCKNGWILDGYPRNAAQVTALDEMLADLDTPLDHVVALEAARDVLLERMKKRAAEQGRADDLVMFAFEHANPGDLFIQKSDASTIGDLAKAVQQLFGDTGTNIIGTRHGEKLFETLMTREERLRSEDMGGYYRVAADNRDLNYDKFVVKGEVHTMADDSYTSHNTHRLDVEGTVRKILTTDYVQNALKEMEAEKA